MSNATCIVNEGLDSRTIYLFAYSREESIATYIEKFKYHMNITFLYKVRFFLLVNGFNDIATNKNISAIIIFIEPTIAIA